MKCMVTFYIFFYLAGQIGFGQNKKDLCIDLMELIASPEKYSGKVIVVCGFLLIQHAPHELTASILYLNEEDRNPSLKNGILVVPSKQMILEKEKINHRYVSLTGKVRVTPTASGERIVGISQVQRCELRPMATNP